jgi:hypothetical protein
MLSREHAVGEMPRKLRQALRFAGYLNGGKRA